MNFKNILVKLGLSFNEEEPKAAETPNFEPQRQEETAAEKKKELSLKDNAIDRRDKAVKAIVKSLQQAMGSSLNSLSRMDVWVIIPEKDYNPMDFSWADAILS